MIKNSAHFASIDNGDKLDSAAEILTAIIMKAHSVKKRKVTPQEFQNNAYKE